MEEYVEHILLLNSNGHLDFGNKMKLASSSQLTIHKYSPHSKQEKMFGIVGIILLLVSLIMGYV
jgi:predicted secreted protein